MPPQIDRFLNALIKADGSDLHIATGNPPRLRVNGVLRPLDYPALDRDQVLHLIREIMTAGQREDYETHLDADFAYSIAEQARFRVNVMTSHRGPGAVFRRVPTDVPNADAIGLPPSIRRIALEHKGLVLVTGPTGSGKSTTLAAIVDLINENRPDHILTIEDPIEFVHRNKRAWINQREVGQHTTSFTRALRAALREDPDVILVGEMRDIETIALACTAAETGHLVLATLHTNSAPKAIDRIVDSFPPEQQQQIRVQLAETLKYVVAQQLLPRKDGKGRVATHEIMVCTPAISTLIRDGKTHQIKQVLQTQRKEGMQTMDQALLEAVKKGLVRQEDALDRAHDRRTLEADLRRDGATPPSPGDR